MQCTLIGGFREFPHQAPGLIREGLSPRLGTLEAVGPLDERQYLAEGHAVVAALLQNRLDQIPLPGIRFFERIDQRKRNFSFTEIAAHRLSESLLTRCEVEHVID